MHKSYNYFYVLTDIRNGCKYAGVHSTNDLNDNYTGSGNIVSAIAKKHSKEVFNMTEQIFFDSVEEAYQHEELFVTEEIVNDPQWYNLTTGGKRPPSHLGKTRTDETRSKLSKAKAGRNNPAYGTTKSDETKKKLSDALTGKCKPSRTKEHCKKISKANKGKLLGDKNPAKRLDVREKLRNAQLGKTHTTETKHKISEYQRTSNVLRGVPKEIETCPHCGKQGGKGAMQRWHFNKCKQKDSTTC